MPAHAVRIFGSDLGEHPKWSLKDAHRGSRGVSRSVRSAHRSYDGTHWSSKGAHKDLCSRSPVCAASPPSASRRSTPVLRRPWPTRRNARGHRCSGHSGLTQRSTGRPACGRHRGRTATPRSSAGGRDGAFRVSDPIVIERRVQGAAAQRMSNSVVRLATGCGGILKREVSK